MLKDTETTVDSYLAKESFSAPVRCRSCEVYFDASVYPLRCPECGASLNREKMPLNNRRLFKDYNRR